MYIFIGVLISKFTEIVEYLGPWIAISKCTTKILVKMKEVVTVSLIIVPNFEYIDW